MGHRQALWVLGLVVVATAAVAQPRSDADKLYLDGVRLLKKGDVAGAVERFQLALELQRSAPLLFNTGQAVAKLGRLAEAKQLLEEARTLAEKSGPPSIVKLATDALAELDARLPRVILELPPDAKGARVELDGKPIEITAEGAKVEPGRHELSVVADGYEPYKEGLTLKDGERRTVRPELERIVKTAAPSAAKPASQRSLVGPAVLGGVGLVALGGATYFYFQVKSIDDERRGLWDSAGCPGPSCPKGEPTRAADLRKDAEGKALVGNILVGVGAVALVAGGAWYFLGKKPQESSAARSGLYVIPAPGGALVGGTL